MSEKLTEIAQSSTRGGFFLFIGNTVSTLTLAACSIVIARLLGPENYGLYSLSIVVPSMLAGLVDLGIGSALINFSAKLRTENKSEQAADLLKSGFLFKVAIGFSMSVICFVFSDSFAVYVLNRPEMSFLIKISSPLILFRSIFTTFNSAFLGLDKMENNALTMNSYSVFKALASPLLVIVGLGVIGALVGHVSGYAFASLVGSLLLFKQYKALGKPSHNGFSKNIQQLLYYGFPLYLSTLLTLFLSQYQNIVLSRYVSNVELGNFGVATTLSYAMNILIFPLSVLFPTFSKINSNSRKLAKLFKLSVKYTAMLIVPASVLVAIMSKQLVTIFYGQEYKLAPSFLSLHILSFLYAGFGSMVFSHLLNGLGKTKTFFRSNLIGMVTLIPLGIGLTMFYGVIGLLVALLFSNISSLAYLLYVTFKEFKLSIDIRSSLGIYFTSFLSAIPLVIFLQLSPFTDLIDLMLGSMIYFYTFLSMAPLTRTITKEDLANLRIIQSNITFLHHFTNLIFKYEETILNLTAKKTDV